MAKTGIICTIGPSSEKAGTLREMMEAGMSVVRLNFSHGTSTDHQKRIDAVRRLNREYACDVKILQDLEGFRIRIGSLEDRDGGSIELEKGQIVFLSNKTLKSNRETIPLDYRGSLQVINTGHIVYVDDGNIALKATDVTDEVVQCEVVIPET